MEYILSNLMYIGAPTKKDENTFTQMVNVKTTISGQIYEGFTNVDTISIDFPSTGLDANQIEALILTSATQFVATKYPNT